MRHVSVLLFYVIASGSAALCHAAVFLSTSQIDTPGLPGFKTVIVTAASTVPGEFITGVDFYGSGLDDSPTARGFFGSMNQIPAGPFTTVFQDQLPQPLDIERFWDSNFLFNTVGSGAVNSPAGFSGESPTSLRALFSRAGGFGQSVPLAQLVIPNGGSVFYRGLISHQLTDPLGQVFPISGIIQIPEPSSAALVCIALIAVAILPRRRQETLERR